MNKKRIIIMAGIGLVSFAFSFAVGLFTNTSEASEAAALAENQVVDPLVGNQYGEQLVNVDSVPQDSRQLSQSGLQRSLAESQLKDLIFDIRSKMTEFKSREKDLELKEQRVRTSLEEMYKNIEQMEDLRVKLASTVTSIKQQRKALDDTLVRVDDIEKKNIQKTALIYDKMKSKGASDIIINLAKTDHLDYAVKITYYMTERTSANLLVEISKTEPSLAALISDKLRGINEVTQ